MRNAYAFFSKVQLVTLGVATSTDTIQYPFAITSPFQLTDIRNMRTTRLSLLLSLFPFLLANAAAQSPTPMNRIDLHNGWTVQTSRKVQATGEAISTPKFQTKGWYRTRCQ